MANVESVDVASGLDRRGFGLMGEEKVHLILLDISSKVVIVVFIAIVQVSLELLLLIMIN